MKSSKAKILTANEYFDLSRFWLLLKLELLRSRRGVFMTLEISLGLLFFAGMVLSIIVENVTVFDDHEENFAYNLMIGGFILSSLAFNDLGSTLKRYRFLTLPVSTLEKFVCMWLLTSVGWVLLYTMVYTFYTLLANQVGQLIFSEVTFIGFNPLSGFSLLIIKYYLVVHGVFLVGAAHFKGYVFPKTLFTLVIFTTVAGTIAYFIMGDLLQESEECLSETNELVGSASHHIWIVIQWVFWWLLAPISWAITYLGLKDKEV